jgi:hypothetical protein
METEREEAWVPPFAGCGVVTIGNVSIRRSEMNAMVIADSAPNR